MYEISNILFKPIKTLSNLILITLFLFATPSSNAQHANSEQIKRLQRSIFIFNFSQQIPWKNNDSFDTFKIGVLGNDRTFIDLKSLSQKRKIQNKKVTVTRFNAVKDINNVQVLYVNKKLNFDINYILSKLYGKNILLISEDYNFNSSMINIVGVGDSFEYEINSDLLIQEGFAVSNTLKASAVSDSQKWKNLYQATEQTLNEVKKDNQEKEIIIKSKEDAITVQQEKINNQDLKIDTFEEKVSKQSQSINELGDLNKIQKKKYEEKLILERRLNDTINAQIKLVYEQQKAIVDSRIKIEEQIKYLEKQKIEIEDNKLILKDKEVLLNKYKTINYLLAFLALVTLIGAFLAYKNYRIKRELAQTLEEKNAIVEENSKLIKAKNQELEQFAYITSHDLKEPLITISGLIALIREDYHDKFDEDGRTTLDFISNSSERMKSLIDALLEYSRLGKTNTHSTVDCNVIVSTIKSDLANVIERTQSTVNIKKLPKITGSEVELRLLFQNLINNGIKFVKPDTKPIIDIDCKKRTDKANSKAYWEFSVKDNGIGIAKEHQDRIFAIFQRLHSREEYEGTGIGLAHCKRIVEAHNGTISLESELGKGTTFYISIPA